MARIVAEKLSGALKPQVVVENRAGGAALSARVRRQGDARRLHADARRIPASISINPSLYANAGFDPRKDFAPIGLIASMPVALIAHPSFPAKTVADVIAIAKKEGRQAQFRHLGDRHRRLSHGRIFQVGRRHQRAIIPYRAPGR